MTCGDKKYKLYKVEWVDSCRYSTWMSVSELPHKHSCDCVSVGFLVKKTKQNIYISSSLDLQGGNICMAMEIPRCAITKMRGIK